MSVAIFISYSHQDTDLAKPVVGLLRGTKDLVFQDLEGIKPGRQWRRQIEDALYIAHLIVLFWCYHSSRSKEVRKEYELALSTGKNVLPVLLDGTPLPKELNEFQWVDFRQLAGLHRSSRRWISIAIAVVAVLVMVGFLISFFWFSSPEKNLPPSPFLETGTVVFGLSLLVAVTTYALVSWLEYHDRTEVPPINYQKQMAETLQEAFFRRGIGAT